MPRILVVEDQEPVRKLVSEHLRNAGHEVESVGAPEEALRLSKECPFDLVLSDVRMPEMDGHELARRMAALCPQTRVVLMSGYDLDCEMCPYSPNCKVLAKPFSAEHLSACITQTLAAPPPRVKRSTR